MVTTFTERGAWAELVSFAGEQAASNTVASVAPARKAKRTQHFGAPAGYRDKTN
jgi:hypothetical protein